MRWDQEVLPSPLTPGKGCWTEVLRGFAHHNGLGNVVTVKITIAAGRSSPVEQLSSLVQAGGRGLSRDGNQSPRSLPCWPGYPLAPSPTPFMLTCLMLSWLVLEHTETTPAPGPLHWLSPLPGRCSPAPTLPGLSTCATSGNTVPPASCPAQCYGFTGCFLFAGLIVRELEEGGLLFCLLTAPPAPHRQCQEQCLAPGGGSINRGERRQVGRLTWAYVPIY